MVQFQSKVTVIVVTVCLVLQVVSFLFGMQSMQGSRLHMHVTRVRYSHDKPYQEDSRSLVEVVSWSPRVLIYHNFISQDIAEQIIKIAAPDVERSKVVGDVVSESRTSDGVFLTEKWMRASPILRILEKRIAEWTHLPYENGEAFYFLRYQNGQEYKAHQDFFSPGVPATTQSVEKYGNRYATVIVYLQTPEEGGETSFPKANLKVTPKQGDALLFWDLHPDNSPDGLTMHAGLPVLKGTKYCMTKWIRERQFFQWSDHLSEEEKNAFLEEEKATLNSLPSIRG